MEGSFEVNREAKYLEHLNEGLFDRIERQNPGLSSDKRVLRASERTWENNLQRLVDVQNGFEDKAVACFLRRILPGESSQLHRHNFEAIGYVLKGRGYEIHDGERIDWAKDDVVFIPANVWHQHFNSDPEEEAVILLITNWPLLFHLGVTTLEPAPSWEDALSRPSAIPNPRGTGARAGAAHSDGSASHSHPGHTHG